MEGNQKVQKAPNAPKWLDEGLPVGVFDDESSERLWDECCASHPDSPFAEWENKKV